MHQKCPILYCQTAVLMERLIVHSIDNIATWTPTFPLSNITLDATPTNETSPPAPEVDAAVRRLPALGILKRQDVSMIKGECPKCKSKEIVPDVQVVDKDQGSKGDL